MIYMMYRGTKMLEKQKTINKIANIISEMKEISNDNFFQIEDELSELNEKLELLKDNVLNKLSAWDRVSISRSSNRLTSSDYVETLFEDFIELHGDRLDYDDPNIIGGIALCNNIPVTIIAQQKKTDNSLDTSNTSKITPYGYRKSLRLMKQAEKFNRSIICFIDTPGANYSWGAEEQGQGEAIGRSILEISDIRVPILSIIIGEGIGGSALALALGNEIWMLENSIYSILSPENFTLLLGKDSKSAKEVVDIMKITSYDLFQLGVIDKIIKEPLGGIEEREKVFLSNLKNEICTFLEQIKVLTKSEIYSQRYLKFRKIY